MARVDPFIVPIPRKFLNDPDPEVRGFFEYFVRWAHDIWMRTGGSSDAVADRSTIFSNNSSGGSLEGQSSSGQMLSSVISMINDLPSQRSISNDVYYALNNQFINAESNSTIYFPENPDYRYPLITRNGDGSRITLKANGRLLNDETDGIISKKGACIVWQYFPSKNSWYAR